MNEIRYLNFGENEHTWMSAHMVKIRSCWQSLNIKYTYLIYPPKRFSI